MKKLLQRSILFVLVGLFFSTILGLSNQAFGQCSGVTLQAIKVVRNYNNTKDSTIYIDKDSSCDYYTVRMKVSGYPSGSQFKYYIGSNTINQTTDTVSKQYVGYNGYIDVKVEILDGNNNLLCTIQRDSMYKLGVALVPKITITPTTMCNGPDTLYFNDSTPNITSRLVIIDGTVYQDKAIIKHKFSSTGCKKIIVNYTNTDGCSITKTYDSIVCIYNKPTVDFSTNDTAGCLTYKVKYSPNITTNGNTITNYSWNFPSGTPSTDTTSNPGQVSYSSVGLYDASLQITTASGCIYTKNKSGIVNVGDSVPIQIKVIQDSLSCLNRKSIIVISNYSTYKGGDAFWYSDKSTNFTLYSPNSKGDTFTCQFPFTGTKNIYLDYKLKGCKKTFQTQVIVQPPVLKAGSLDNITNYCSAPYTFKLKSTSTLPTTGSSTICWIVSDSAGSFKVPDTTICGTDTPYFIAKKFGKYSVRLKISCSNGCTDSTTLTDYLKISDPVAKINLSNKVICQCERVVLSDKSGKYSSDTARREYIIYGRLYSANQNDTLKIYKTSLLAPKDTTSYQFCDTGRYVTQLLIYNDAGCRDTIWDTVTVTSLKATFLADDSNVCVNTGVNFNGEVKPLNPAVTSFTTVNETWYTKHKDSSTWEQISVPYNYSTVGIYDVAYVARRQNFCQDSVTKMNYIKVSDITSDFKAASTSGCKNSAIKFDTTKFLDINNWGTKKITYQWSVNPSTNVTIANATAASTNITFGDNGSYDVSLTVTDTNTGCSFTESKAAYITIGVVAGFSLPSNGCSKEVITINDGSQNNPTNFGWKVLPAAMASKVTFDTTSSGTPSSPKIQFSDSGCYQILQTVYNGTCKDTVSRFICIERTVPKFSAPDTFFYCAPQLAKFYSKGSINATMYKWDFGDGKYVSTGADSFAVYYETNDSCRDIKLISYSTNGCSDTLTKYCYIRFNGPVPKFELTSNIGCEPLNVKITDKSYKIKQPTFDFGDGNVQNNNSIPTSHTYYSPGANLYSVYYPSLSATNGAGCYAQYPLASNKQPDSVVVYKRAKAYFKSDTVAQCEPMEIQLTDTSKFSTVWRWTITPSTFTYTQGTDSTSQFPIVKFEPGTYTIKLWVTNGSGCGDSITKTNYIVSHKRAKADFAINDSVECKSLTSTFTNNSTTATSYSWDFGDGGTSTAKNPNHTYAPGTYTVKLWVTNTNNCADSITKDTLVHVFENPVPKIYSNYVTGCEPFTTTLYGDSSTFTDSFNWLVYWPATGAGIGYTDQNPSLASGTYGPGQWNVKLIVSNTNGCIDSVDKVNYLTVYQRAKPDFSTTDTLGCDTINSKFNNLSAYANQYQWDFGNSVTSTATSPTNGYTIGNYSVKLWANNANNCPDSITKNNIILVVNKPIAKIYSNYTKGCEPFVTDIYGDSTLYATSYNWDMGNTSIQTVTNPKESYTPGVYSVKLVVSNTYGCMDSITKTNFITVFQKPLADYVSDKPSTCFGEDVTFSDVSTSYAPPTNWFWDFGDGTTDTLQFPPKHIYATPGFKTVKFMMTDLNGCKDTIEYINKVWVDDSIPPVVTQIKYVTVDPINNQVIVVWEENNDASFAENKLYRIDPAPLNIYTTNIALGDTVFTDAGASNINTQTYSYYLTTGDTCNYVSQPGTQHTTMLLDASTFAPMTNLITWSPYIGWGINGIKKYDVYKMAGVGGTFSFFKSLAATDTFMIDSLLCDSDYTYFVVATNKTGEYTSSSNADMNHPPFVQPAISVPPLRSTVIDNKYTNTNWEPSNHPAIKNYIVDRNDGSGWQNRYGVVANNETEFTDINVNVGTTSYMYRVSVEDYCGNASPTAGTDYGKTILLDARIENEFVKLAWTPYENWVNGVGKYQIELDYGNGDWRKLATLNAFDTPWTDNEVHEDITTNYCYRIVAVENDTFPEYSTSNVDCSVVPSRIYIPSAFTPNGRGPAQNEVFKPTYISIFNKNVDDELKKFEFIVYDRWGQRIFYTNDLSQGWDGTLRGKPLPDDVYLYVVRGRGLDGYEYSRNGTVHLIR